MTLNTRERNIAIGTSAAVVLGLIYWFAYQPYADAVDSLNGQKTELAQQLANGKLSLRRERELEPVWAEMRRGGLRNDDSTAESQFYAAILYWAQHARTSDPSFKTDPPKPDKDAAAKGFSVVTFHVTVTGTLSQISELLWSVETAVIPVRVTDVQLTPKKEGFDSVASPLTAQITISTTSWTPPTEQAPQQPALVPAETAMSSSSSTGGGI